MFKNLKLASFLIIFVIVLFIGETFEARAYFSFEKRLGPNNLSFEINFGEPKTDIICNLEDIRGKAGQIIEFPDITCNNSLLYEKIIWDLDISDGINSEQPDLTGNQPKLVKGFQHPGTYQATVIAQDQDGETQEKNFIVNIANPDLGYQDLVINEFLPNPFGIDKALKPEGEWIEIYNKLSVSVDLLGFVLYDAYDDHPLPIIENNADNNSTLIGPDEYKVIYRNGDQNFSLNNSGPEEVRLYDGFIVNQANLLDQFEYTSEIKEDESFSRIPNIFGNFKKTDPTKGFAN